MATSTHRRRQGFTLIELMTVVAILALLVTLSLYAYDKASGAGTPQNAAADLSGALSLAHQTAVAEQYPVWLVIFTNVKKDGTAGKGAYFLVADRDGTFGTTGSPVTGDLKFSTFIPPNVIPNAASLAGRTSPVLRAIYMNGYAKQNVSFGIGGGLAFGQPFTALTPSDCTFCDGTPKRGAIIFDGEGKARFVNSSGVPLAAASSTAGGRAGGLSLVSDDRVRQYLFAVSGPTSYTSFFFKK